MFDWPHAPVHRLGEAGAFVVTAGTHRKQHLFREPERLKLLHDSLLAVAGDYGWRLQAWAVFSNHYHFVALSPDDASSLSILLKRLHAITALDVNRLDSTPGRKVWFQYWDTHLTYERSYLARLNYVHQNPVHHGLVPVASRYPWCSAAWFERTADRAFYDTVVRMKVDRVNVHDEFDVDCGD